MDIQKLSMAEPVVQRQVPQQTVTSGSSDTLETEDLGLPFYYNIVGTLKGLFMGKQTINSITVTRPVDNNIQQTTTTTTVEVDNLPYTSCCPGVYVELGILAIIIVVGVIGFIKSVKSRKYYKCTNCGESFRSENMDSMACKVCGAPLKEIDDPNITDKTK